MDYLKTNQVLILVCIICVALSRDAAAATQRDYLLNLLRTLQRRTVQDDPYIRATCSMQDNPNLADDIKAVNNVQGTVTFRQLRTGGSLMMSVSLTGLDTASAVQHGFHVHETGDITTNGCDSTGGHYNPFNKIHGGPGDEDRHVGDFGNVEMSSTGSVEWEYADDVASLLGVNTIIGRAVVLHKDTDDLGNGDEADSLTTGHAGARLACCVITAVL